MSKNMSPSTINSSVGSIIDCIRLGERRTLTRGKTQITRAGVKAKGGFIYVVMEKKLKSIL